MALPPGELAALQAAMLDTLPLVATIQRTGTLGTPGTDASWTNVAGLTSIAAGLTLPQGNYQQQLAAALVEQSTWVVTLPAGSDVRRSDRVLVSGLTLTVQHLLTPVSNPVDVQVLASTPR